MKNKIELKKSIILITIVIVVANIILGIASYYQYKTYTNEFNKKMQDILTNIISQYPDIDKNELMQILNDKTQNEENFPFDNYGINLAEESIIIKNEEYANSFLILNLIILTVFSIALVVIFLKYNYDKDKKLKEIITYIEELNNKNYKLDIEENSEDELSILKNEIYKTTVMLKEVAENSSKDKLNLKDSLSDISHQLKTPLTSITVMLDNILDNPQMNEDIKLEFIKDIKREIININFLVDSLLKLSKLDVNSVRFIKKKEYMKYIIESSIKNVGALSDLRNVTIQMNVEEKAQMYCDPKWQTEAITNILKNCVEHSNVNSKVIVSCEENKMYSKIEIKDFGVGIDEKDLPHIFERFYKGKNSLSESVGIGLALAKSIIEADNGYISVDSKLRQGSVFTIKYLK